jgi:hypothetical protein
MNMFYVEQPVHLTAILRSCLLRIKHLQTLLHTPTNLKMKMECIY